MYNIIKFIDFNTFEVYIITLREEKEGSIIYKFKDFPIQIISLKIKSKLINLLKIYFCLKSTLKSINPSIIHTHCPRSLFLSSILPNRFKKIHTIHNFPGLVDRAIYGNIKGSMVAFLMLKSFTKIDTPIACASNIKDLLLKEHKINVKAIKNGTNFSVSNFDEKLKENIRKTLGLSQEKKYFIFVGRFSNEKNPKVLVDIFSKLEYQNIELIMLGDGPLLERIKEKKSNNITFVGFTTKVRDYLIAADYFVSSSLTEGMPNSVLEAMSVGLPLLLSNIPAHQEIINETENKIGFLFDLNHENDFILKMEALINLPQVETSLIVQENFTAHYTAKKMSQAYQKEYIGLSENKI